MSEPSTLSEPVTMRVLGMMSGTSVDAVDTVLVDLARDPSDPDVLTARLLDVDEHPWPGPLREAILDVLPPASSDVATWDMLHAQIGAHLGEVAARVLGRAGGADLVVSHGQTLHHWAAADGRVLGTLQIGDAARIAEATHASVLHDLRSADVARGGQGAPFAPALDVLLMGEEGGAVLNLGGIANVTLVEAAEPADSVGSTDSDDTSESTASDGASGASGQSMTVRAGDVGPANALLDSAVRRATAGRMHCDEDGRLAASGTVDQRALAELLADPFFALPLPRSTGREHFDAAYVERMSPRAARLDLPDLLATLTELTARTVADLVREAGAPVVHGSGGGMRNPVLRARLADLLDPVPLRSSADLGVPSDAKEALLMAVVGWLSVHGIPALPAGPDGGPVTGARSAAVLGSLTPPVPVAGLDPCCAAPRGTSDPSDAPAARPRPRRLRLLGPDHRTPGGAR
ncbi:anhydro-N-acetylmuramic acid kinase [Brachybacterium sp. NPDC056505]|uniref:anhydro-N-acetylmuramic acid kinase n=1 Tax=Brachybacterium sp. NPDC056505 TaxID=3345843 RepID=UPI00367024DE